MDKDLKFLLSACYRTGRRDKLGASTSSHKP